MFPEETRKFIVNENIVTNIYGIQWCVSTMCGYFCIAFADFMLKGKHLLEYTIFFSFNKYKKMTK